jgi:hypothetical protein
MLLHQLLYTSRPKGAPGFRLLLLQLLGSFLLTLLPLLYGSQPVPTRPSCRCPASRASAAPATAPATRPVTPHGIRSTATTADWTPDTLVRPCARTGPMACVVHFVPPVWHRVHLVPPVEQKVQVRIHTAHMQCVSVRLIRPDHIGLADQSYNRQACTGTDILTCLLACLLAF